MAEQSRQKPVSRKGAVILAVLILAAVLIFMLDPLTRAFRRDVRVVAVLPSAPGIQPNSPVWIGGTEVGRVREIDFRPAAANDSLSLVVLSLEIPRSLRSQVRADARVRITSARMIGAKVIDILPGTAAEPLAPNDTLRQRETVTTAEVMAAAGALKAALDTVMADARPLAARARQRLGAVAQLRTSVTVAQRELAALSDDLANSPALAALNDDQLRASIARLQAAANAFSEGLAEQAESRAEVSAALAPLRRHADELSAQLAAMSADSTPNGTLPRLQRDSALAVALRGAQAQLDSLIAEAKKNPLRFVF